MWHNFCCASVTNHASTRNLDEQEYLKRILGYFCIFKSVCCGPSKDPPLQGVSLEKPQHTVRCIGKLYLYKGEQLLLFHILFSECCRPPKKSTFKGKNMLLLEQILYFKSLPLLRRT